MNDRGRQPELDDELLSAYLDDEMDPFLEYDFEVVNTDHAPYIRSQVDLWEQILGDFIEGLDRDRAKAATE